MYWPDHAPPHFHAEYGEFEAFYSIETCMAIKGNIPSKQDKLIQAWAIMHQDELKSNWESLQSTNKSITPIKPLS